MNNIYGLFEEEQEKFINFTVDIFLNLQNIALIKQVEIRYQTNFTDVFQFVKNDLIDGNMNMNECDDYHFVYINDKGEEEQLFHDDWNQPVKDLNIFTFDYRKKDSPSKYLFHTMKLEQTLGCLDINHYKLEKMIGIKKDNMTKVIPNDELKEFEESSRNIFKEANKCISAMSLEEKLLVEHPIEMSNCRKSFDGPIEINISIDASGIQPTRKQSLNQTTVFKKTLIIQASDTVLTVIQNSLIKFKEWIDNNKPSDYLLRIAEREEYLVSLEPVDIIKFQYLASCVQMNIQPNFLLVRKKIVEKNNICARPLRGIEKPIAKVGKGTVNENEFKHMSMNKSEFIYIHDLWKQFKKSSCTDTEIVQTEFTNYDNTMTDEIFDHMLDNVEHTDLLYVVKISSISYPKSCAILRDQKVVIMASLYHGEKSLCEHQYREWSSDNVGCEIVFPIEIWNLPRMARLSFALTVVRQCLAVKDFPNNTQKKFLGWGNIMVYNHRSLLKTDDIKYRLWPSVKPNVHPTGSVYSNPDGELITPVLQIQLLPKLIKFKKIVYPPIEILIPEAGKMLEDDVTLTPSCDEREKITEILARSSIDDIMEDEQIILWKYRYYIRDYYQDSLPKILNTRPWNNFENVAKMHHLACGWPIDKEVIIALELLGSDVPDCNIRMMAVDSLKRISWQDFSLYLLQICQCLKYESYLNSNLTQMLLQKMIMNAKIAQSMFYYLKVEISASEWCKVPFSTILYNYLQYSPTRCETLLRQYRATNEICQHNKALMQYSAIEGDRKIQALENFRATLSKNEKDMFNELTCPLNCNINLKMLKTEKCKFMDSKMRPIMLSWNVNAEFVKDYLLIYKNGDDLRQDALIVQMMHIMDSIWQRAGLDLKLSPYDVLACSKTEGYIQVVQNAETLANIFRSVKTSNLNLFQNWLKSKNSRIEMTPIVKNFTSSCGAYCVATFILGIGDRHSDNIMIREDGHFFHIDFGHILGNFKKIMGGMVSREWTKFILVQGFLQIIADGNADKEKAFKELCCQGYLALRKHSNLILSLFKIMVNAGIPEITSTDDLNYLKETLQIGKSDDDAATYFRMIYDDTRKKEMFVSMNWVAHNIRRNNN